MVRPWDATRRGSDDDGVVMLRRRGPALIVALASSTAMAACSGGSSTPSGSSSPGTSASSASRPGAAEPGAAPSAAAAPAGTVRPLGARTPEGIVVDPTTGLVAVAVRHPNRLLLVDGTSLAVRRTVPLPGHARHLQLAGAGGPVLVPAEDASELVEVALPAGTTRVTKVARYPHDATRAANGDLVVGNEFGKSLSVVRDGRVVRTITGLVQPGGVVPIARGVLVVDVKAFAVSTYDLAAGRRTGTISGGTGPTHAVTVDADHVAVTDTRGGALLVVDPDPLRQVARLALPGRPYGLAADPQTQTVWVTLTSRNEVVGVDVSGAQPRVVARYPTVRQPNTVAVLPGSHTVYVAGASAGQIQVIRR